jgi:hypothetical protein
MEHGMGGACGTCGGEKGNAFTILVLKTMVKKPLGRPSVDGMIILNGRRKGRIKKIAS